MPQIFQVLRCYKCLIFQVHQTKKLNKWECKLCGEKQSLKRHYGLGTAKECRLHVQKLNNVQGDINEKNNFTESDEEFKENFEDTNEKFFMKDFSQSKKGSKWDDYIDETENNMAEFVEDEGDMFINDTKVVLEIPKKRKKRTDHHKTRKIINSCNTHTANHSINEEKKEKILTSKPESDKIMNESRNRSDTKKSSLKFLPPISNTNSKWSQYEEESKCNNENVTNYRTCNRFTINNKQTHNSSNESIEAHTSETITCKTISNVYSKRAKFVNDNNNELECSLNKNSKEYEVTTNNSTSKYSNNNSEYLLGQNISLQNISGNMKKSVATSLFDDCDFDVLDI